VEPVPRERHAHVPGQALTLICAAKGEGGHVAPLVLHLQRRPFDAPSEPRSGIRAGPRDAAIAIVQIREAASSFERGFGVQAVLEDASRVLEEELPYGAAHVGQSDAVFTAQRDSSAQSSADTRPNA